MELNEVPNEGLPNERLIELQSILEALSNEDVADPKVLKNLRTRVGRLFQSNPADVPQLLLALHPLLRDLPVEFIDLIGDQAQRVLYQDGEVVDEVLLDFVEEALLRSSPVGRWSWLTILSLIQTPGSLDILIREVLDSEIRDQQQVMQAFAPLMQRPHFDPDWIFPALFEGLNRSELAPVILDLANFCYRNGLCEYHPATDRASELSSLLDQLTKRMVEIESDPTAWSGNANQISKMISDSVALIVSLCDTIAQLKYREALPVIEKVSQLRHRRIQAEAAFSLAMLGNQDGEKMLLALAAEPVSRLRVIQYAEELGLVEKIDEQFKSSTALAESELAIWLSQPNQMGVPPTVIELVDHRNLYWPSFDDPVDCFLFRFEYRLGENSFSNLAIVGPMIHTFLSSLESLGIEDAYAAFAGWQADHEEIVELDLSSLSPHRKTDLFKLERRLHDFGAQSIETTMMGVFFGEVFIVAKCIVEDPDRSDTGDSTLPSLAVVDGNSMRVFAVTEPRPLEDSVVFGIYVGNKLISAFNA